MSVTREATSRQWHSVPWTLNAVIYIGIDKGLTDGVSQEEAQNVNNTARYDTKLQFKRCSGLFARIGLRLVFAFLFRIGPIRAMRCDAIQKYSTKAAQT